MVAIEPVSNYPRADNTWRRVGPWHMRGYDWASRGEKGGPWKMQKKSKEFPQHVANVLGRGRRAGSRHGRDLLLLFSFCLYMLTAGRGYLRLAKKKERKKKKPTNGPALDSSKTSGMTSLADHLCFCGRDAFPKACCKPRRCQSHGALPFPQDSAGQRENPQRRRRIGAAIIHRRCGKEYQCSN